MEGWFILTRLAEAGNGGKGWVISSDGVVCWIPVFRGIKN